MNVTDLPAALRELRKRFPVVRGRRCEAMSICIDDGEDPARAVGIEAWLVVPRHNNEAEFLQTIKSDIPRCAVTLGMAIEELVEVLSGKKEPEFWFQDETQALSKKR
jgi:hypothetical protein